MFFYHLELCHRKYSCVGAILGKFWALMGTLGSSECDFGSLKIGEIDEIDFGRGVGISFN